MVTAKTRKTVARKASAKKSVTKTTTKKATSTKVAKTVKAVARKVAPQKSPEKIQENTSGIEVIAAAPSAEQTAKTHDAIDMGWVFYFSVQASDVSAAWGILSAHLSGKAVRTGRISAAEYYSDFTPRYATRGDLFVVRRTPTSDEDLGMLAGEIEDAFRDAGIRPGPMLPDTRTIEGVQYTYYRNETDDDGKVLAPAELAQMREKNPFLLMYNPLEKDDPWDDLYYEYVPSVEDVASEAVFASLEPTQSTADESLDLDVEDFDHDLGTLLNKTFSGVGRKYLTQPEGANGWVFDKGLGRIGKPSYRFYACAETIKPIEKTLDAAGFKYTTDQRGSWEGLLIPYESFNTVQRTLSDKTKLTELQEFFKATAQSIGDNVPALPAPEPAAPFADDTLFVSDL